MARPARVDRSTVAATTLTIRITLAESEALEALAARLARQVAGYGALNVTKASVVRTLIQQAARAEGLLPALGAPADPPAPVAIPHPAAAAARPRTRTQRKAPRKRPVRANRAK